MCCVNNLSYVRIIPREVINMSLSSIRKSYLAGFLDGDGSVYVRAKPNSTYRYGFQVAPYIVLFQSSKNKEAFEKLCSCIGFGRMRERSDGILEFTINKIEDIKAFLKIVSPFVILKRKQVELMTRIVEKKFSVKTEKDFSELLDLINDFEKINYSKKRKKRMITP